MLELAQSLRADNAEACRRVLSNRGAEAMRRPSVQILFFEGCPNHKQASELVEQVAHELGLQPEIALVEVTDVETAERLRFLGSPTIRVEGRDVEPGADELDDFAMSCRVYRSEQGLAGQPDGQLIRDALTSAAT
jgi:hypothetical protein